MPVTDKADRLRNLARRGGQQIFQRFDQAVGQITSATTLADLERLLQQGRFDEALVGLELAANHISVGFRNAATLAGDDTARFIGGKVRLPLDFDTSDSAYLAALRAEQQRMVNGFITEQNLASRFAVLEGVARGMTPRQQALLFRQSIGLTQRQMQALFRYRDLLERGSLQALQRELRDKTLDGILRSAVAAKESLSRSQINLMVDRFAARLRAHRVRTIAATEMSNAVHLGADTMYQQAIDNGHIESVEQVWRTRADGKVRPASGQGDHVFMGGQRKPFGVPFTSGTGETLRRPGDPNASGREAIRCRCFKETVFTEVVG